MKLRTYLPHSFYLLKKSVTTDSHCYGHVTLQISKGRVYELPMLTVITAGVELRHLLSLIIEHWSKELLRGQKSYLVEVTDFCLQSTFFSHKTFVDLRPENSARYLRAQQAYLNEHETPKYDSNLIIGVPWRWDTLSIYKFYNKITGSMVCLLQ